MKEETTNRLKMSIVYLLCTLIAVLNPIAAIIVISILTLDTLSQFYALYYAKSLYEIITIYLTKLLKKKEK